MHQKRLSYGGEQEFWRGVNPMRQKGTDTVGEPSGGE
jgi:hypothetical protein